MNVGNFVCTDSVFLNNFAATGGVIFGLDNIPSRIFFQNVSFFNNSAETFLFSVLNTNISFQNCIITENINNIFLLESSYIMFNQSTIVNHSCINQLSGCLANDIMSSYLYFTDSIINHVNSLKDALIYSDSCILFMERSLFKDISSSNGVGPFLLAYSSIISSFYTSFENYDINLFYIQNGSLSIVDNSFINENKTFKTSSKSIYGVIYCDLCQDSFINRSTFSGNNNSIIGLIVSFII